MHSPVHFRSPARLIYACRVSALSSLARVQQLQNGCSKFAIGGRLSLVLALVFRPSGSGALAKATN